MTPEKIKYNQGSFFQDVWFWLQSSLILSVKSFLCTKFREQGESFSWIDRWLVDRQTD